LTAIEIVRSKGICSVTDSMSFGDLAFSMLNTDEDPTNLVAEARTLFPYDLFLVWLQALGAERQGRHLDVLRATDILIEADQRLVADSGLAYDSRIFREWPHHLRGMSLFALRRFSEAADAFAAARSFAPLVRDYVVKEALARARVHAGKLAAPTETARRLSSPEESTH
jgi:hypothetical protein